MESEYHIFSGRVYKIGVIRFVDVPGDISKQIGEGAHVPVAGTVEGVPLRSTLVSRGKGAYRLAIHSDIRKKLRMDTGAVVEWRFAGMRHRASRNCLLSSCSDYAILPRRNGFFAA